MKRLAFALFLAMPAHAVTISMTWEHDLLDMGGQAIPPEMISYNVYVSTDGAEPTALITVVDNSYLWEHPPIGCHTVFVTAYRADADLESAWSNSEEKCVTADTDGTLEMLVPIPPKGFWARWRLFN